MVDTSQVIWCLEKYYGTSEKIQGKIIVFYIRLY